MQTYLRALALATAALATAAPMWAQGGNQGTMQGIITDAQGAVVAHATIVATDLAKGLTQTVTSGANGDFTIPVLPTGHYRVTVDAPGFTEAEVKDVAIEVGTKVNVPVKLAVAGSTEKVQVTDRAPVIDTTQTSVNETVNSRAVDNLPTNGRNFLDFTLLTPGVARDPRTGDLSFGGQKGTLNSVTIDGTDNNNVFYGQALGRTGSGRAPYQFSQDAVQEFQVNTSTYAPEFGRAGGAVINVVTKSGTNEFHGTGFEFLRDRGLNANDQTYSQQLAFYENKLRASAPVKPGYHFNQFGGDIGGPIVKDKLFFFFDYDGQRNQAGIPVALNLPTIAATATDPGGAAQQAAAKYLIARSTTYNTSFNQNVYLGKVDYHLSDRELLSFRYNAQRFTGLNLENSGSSSAFEHTGSSNVSTDTGNVELVSTLSPRLVNTARFSYQRDDEPGLSNSTSPEAAVRNGGATLLTVGRNNFSPREAKLTRQQYIDNVTFVAGAHTLKFGGDFLRDQVFNYFPGNFSGAYVFNSLENFGHSLLNQPLVVSGTGSATLQLTEAFAGAGTAGPVTHPDQGQLAFFAQDDWRIGRRLDITYGVRYDRQSIHQPGIRNPNAILTGIDTSQVPIDDVNFGPRLGFAYTPSESGRTVIRGGGGIFYGNTPSILPSTAISSNGLAVQTYVFQPNAANPTFPGGVSYPGNVCGAPQDTPRCAPPTGAAAVKPNLYAFSTHYHQPEVIQYNAQIEQQITRNTSLTVGYLGVRGLRLTRTRDTNFTTEAPATITGTNGQTFSYERINTKALANPNFNHAFQFESTAHSTYNGLFWQLDQRFSGGLQFSASYTFSKVIDDNPDATAVVFGSDDAKLVYDPLRPRIDLAPGNSDVRNRFIFSGVWDLDYFTRNLHGFTRQIAGGWQISSIVNAQSGQPYSALLNTSLNGSGEVANQRVPGTNRNAFRLPSLYTWDPRIVKTVPLTERVHLELIGEGFNVLNHTNVYGVAKTQYNVVTTNGVSQLSPNASGTQAFGIPTSFTNGQYPSYGGRVIQVAGKIRF